MIRQPDLARAATMACRCIVRLGTGELPVRPLDILHRCRHTAVFTYEEAAAELGLTERELDRRCGAADAFTIRGQAADGGTRYVVCYRAGGNPARLNFTLAHELGHILLKHEGSASADEHEADYFASCLLCPDAVVKRFTDDSAAAEKLAGVCYVSVTAAEMALKRKKTAIDAKLQQEIAALFGCDFHKGRTINF